MFKNFKIKSKAKRQIKALFMTAFFAAPSPSHPLNQPMRTELIDDWSALPPIWPKLYNY